jgi:hypothetical protein
MKKETQFVVLVSVAVSLALSNCASAQETREGDHSVWRPLPSTQERGLLAERVELSRKKRLWHMVDSGYGDIM